MSWFIKKLKEENDLQEVKQRYKISLIIQYCIIVTIPVFLTVTIQFQNNFLIDFFRDYVGFLTIIAIPIYLLYLSVKKDKVGNKVNVVYFVTSWNFIMNYVIFKVLSDGLLSIDFPTMLSQNIPIFKNMTTYDILVDIILAPILVLYSIFGYLILTRLMAKPDLVRPKNFKLD